MAFIRKYKLIIGLPLSIGGNFDKQINDTNSNAYVLTDHQIEFEILKSNSAEANKGYITIVRCVQI